ncbi:Reticulon-like protein B8 [Bienertia sinuspersici]
MPENITAENLMNNIMETISEGAQNQKSSGSFFDEQTSNHVASQFNRLFGRQEPVHKVLGGGKFGATAIWVMFEWLNYHFLSLICFAVALGMIAQFLWSNASGVLNRSPSEVPRIQLPDEWFVNVGVAVGREVNRVLRYLQNIACSGNLKQFVMVISGLVAAAMIGAGFVAAHTLPVLYEKYDDQIDGFVENLLSRMTHHYKNIDARVLSKMPTRKWGKKHE